LQSEKIAFSNIGQPQLDKRREQKEGLQRRALERHIRFFKIFFSACDIRLNILYDRLADKPKPVLIMVTLT
jgi:hypothetical protein